MTNAAETLQAVLRAEMTRQGISYGALAFTVRMDRSNLYGALNTATNPTIGTMARIAEGLNRRIVYRLEVSK